MKSILITAAAFALSSPVQAQQTPMPPMDHSKMDHSSMPMKQADMMAMMNDPNNTYGAAEMEMHKK
jgi:hypothetical protein